MNIICIDIDKSLLSRSDKLNNEIGVELFMNNLMKIQDVMRQVDGEVFLISDWSRLFTYVGGDINIKMGMIEIINEVEDGELIIFILSALKTYFDGRWYGIGNGDKVREVEKLLEGGNRVVVLDGHDMGEVKHENYKHIKTVDVVTRCIVSDMMRFFK